MTAVTSRWDGVLIVGCSHGVRASKPALEAVLRFKRAFKPKHTAHIGDFIDTSCLRTGAPGTQDEYDPIRPDLSSGLNFLEQLQPTIVVLGNHDWRPYLLRNHPKAIIAELAAVVVKDIEATCQKLRAKVTPYGYKKHHMLADDCKLMHGTFCNEAATRDHAEAYAPPGGIVVHAHTHRTGYARGRRADNPLGICVGTLANIPAMEYAAQRKSTLSWSAGFVWGFTNQKRTQLWVHDNGQDQTWRLPIV